MKFLLIFFLFTTVVAFKDYSQYVALNLIPRNENALEYLNEIQLTLNYLDFWKPPSHVNIPVHVMLHEGKIGQFIAELAEYDIAVDLLTRKIQELIDAERDILSQKLPFTDYDSCTGFALDQYHRFEEIEKWLDCLASKYPNIVTTFEIGKTFENRNLKAIKIGAASAKKGYWIDAGIHAREWIAPATAIWIINHLLTTYSTSDVTKSLVDNINFYIITSLNPDGYAYSHATDRLWRKTRSGPYVVTSGDWWGHHEENCYGVDPNRNWDSQWGVSGASTDPCNQIYMGPRAFSEPETNATSTWLLNNRDRIQVYISLHSYGQEWFYPYGYSPNTYPPDKPELEALANYGAGNLTSVHGTEYQVGSAADLIYSASGASDDWAKEKAGIKWVYLLELPDKGYFGFTLPAQSIIPTAEETWAGLQIVAQNLLN